MEDYSNLERAKDSIRKDLYRRIDMLERVESTDHLAVLMFGAAYSALSAFHVLKKSVTKKSDVHKQCVKIQSEYVDFISSDN